MTISEASAKITALVVELNQYNEAYYNKNKSLISDLEYDLKKKELEALEAQYPSLVRGDSPTQRVGEDRDDFFLKVQHTIPMLSLDNTYSYEEVREFDKRVRDLLAQEVGYVCELKYDGMAIALRYEKGQLVYAATRGNGVEGDNVTNNILQIAGIPHHIPNIDFDFEVRGEVYMLNSYFEEQAQDPENKNKLKTPRNATSGTVKTHDPSKVAERRLQCVLYQYYGKEICPDHWNTIEQLRKWGFPVGELRKPCSDIDEVIATIEAWKDLRYGLDYDTDGAVVKVNSLAERNRLGATSHSPRWAIAYKYPPEQKETRLDRVEFQVGRTGVVTPVAIFDTIKLNHADIQKATLHNADQLLRLDLHEHDTILIERAGEVIPKVVGVNKEKREAGAKPIRYPEMCPCCGTPLQRVEGQAYYICPNHEGCIEQKIARTIHFTSRDAVDIRSLGDKRIEEWYRNGLIYDTLDVYDLTPAKLLQYAKEYGLKGKIKYDLFGSEIIDKEVAARIELYKQSNEQLLDKIRLSINRPVEALLFGLGVPNLGEVQSEVLLEHFGSLQAVAEASIEEMSNIPNVGQVIAEAIWNYFHAPQNADLLARLTAIGFDLKYHTQRRLSDRLAGEYVVITGKLSIGSRPEVTKRVKAMGATVQSAVNAQTTLLLTGVRPNDKKLRAAHEKGVKILTEEEFNDLLKQ
ncbi:MAG: NAD-dependent DNA ligase LigA [Bacteroides sp.]